MLKKLLPIILILLLALALRTYQLTEIPPGLTHDEANHGREAIEILDGVLRYYFPLNYGSEPVYSYSVAGVMALLGEGLFALRLVNVIFGLAAIVATYLWTKRAFDKTIALITALLIAVSFWPLASSREALRAGMLPFFMVAAVWFFWQIVFGYDNPAAEEGANGGSDTRGAQASKRRIILLVLGFSLSVVITLHIYLASRVAWLLFPLFLLYLAAVHRKRFRRSWKPVLAGLILAGLLTIPMFVYLANNPQSQTRLSMLGSTLQQVREGNIAPIVQNGTGALLAFVWPGYGDQFLAYNIPGRPVFDAITAVFFVIGIVTCLWRWRQPPYAFLLLWFLTGIIPSLVTGATASTTRNLAALPAVYMLPAVGFVAGARSLARRFDFPQRTLLLVGSIIWILFAGLVTAQDYFIHWGQAAEVRTAYQHTLVEELAYLDRQRTGHLPVVMSTVYPGPAHDPSIALLLSGSRAQQMRWVDARSALILPDTGLVQVLIPESTPYHPAFEELLRPLDTIALRADDLDPGFTLYEVDGATRLHNPAETPLADFGGAVQLLQAQWLSPQVSAGETAELLTVWQVADPAKVGPVHAPTDTTDVVFFAHVLDQEEGILAQRDALDAPSWSWQKGDIILQILPVMIPAGTEAGDYQVTVGIYDRPTGQRLPLLGTDNEMKDTTIEISPLRVAQS